MQKEHTPGNWQIDPGDKGDPSVGMAGYAPYVYVDHPTSEGEVVILATLHEPFYDCDEEGHALALGSIEGNAALIGAARGLLLALRALRECINNDGTLRLDAARSQFELVDDPRDARTILAAVDSALATAEGR